MGRASELRRTNDHVPEGTSRKVSGCMDNHTQTTENRSSQGRVCPTTTSLNESGDVDTLVQQVYALFLRQHRRQLVSKRNTSVPCTCERCRPTGLYRTCEQPTTVLRVSSTQLFSHRGAKAELVLPDGSGAFIPSRERRRDFPHRFVKLFRMRFE